MSENMRQTVEELKRHVVDLESQANDTKRTINSMCRVLGDPPAYTDDEMGVSAVTGGRTLQGDEYFNKPLAKAARMVLEARKAAGLGPATTDELYATMAAGGFEFSGKEDRAKTGLTISLAKNTTMFCRLKSGKFGLAEWYGVRPKNGGRKTSAAGAEQDDDEAVDAVSDLSEDVDAEEAAESAAAPKPR